MDSDGAELARMQREIDDLAEANNELEDQLSAMRTERDDAMGELQEVKAQFERRVERAHETLKGWHD